MAVTCTWQVLWTLGMTTIPSKFGRHQGGRSLGAHKKIRHHVNPLKDTYQVLVDLPEVWPSALFKEPALPLHVDIGCARGLFCLEAAEANNRTNFLGLEIRQQLVEAAQSDVQQFGMTNVNFISCNANTNFEHLLQRATPYQPLGSVSIQFPDPWWKARHKKRRVVQPQLVASIAQHLPEGGWLFIQTDVLELAEDMRETIASAESCLRGDRLATFSCMRSPLL